MKDGVVAAQYLEEEPSTACFNQQHYVRVGDFTFLLLIEIGVPREHSQKGVGATSATLLNVDAIQRLYYTANATL